MARLEIQGMEDLQAAFDRISEIPASVTTKALTDMAAIAAAEIKLSGESMGVRDPESSVHILDTIKAGKPKIAPEGGYADITFSGTRTRGRKRVRNAEIAFVNEYGKRNQSARPFVGKAMNGNDEKIAAAGGEVLGDWLDQSF